MNPVELITGTVLFLLIVALIVAGAGLRALLARSEVSEEEWDAFMADLNRHRANRDGGC